MDRFADTEGVDSRTEYLLKGVNREEIVSGFLRSEDFREICCAARFLPY